MSARQGTAGNVIAALASFFIPGLGQLIQGRPGKAIWHLVLTGVLWALSLLALGLIPLGWIMHVWSAIEAARYES